MKIPTQLKDFIKDLFRKPRLATAVITILLAVFINGFIYASAKLEFKKASVEAAKNTSMGAPDRFMEVRDGIFDEAFRKMWFLSFFIFASGYFVIIILPDVKEEVKNNGKMVGPEAPPTKDI